MADGSYVYKGLEVCPLVFPHTPTRAGFAHDYDAGFDAAVRIRERSDNGLEARSRVFRLNVATPFPSAGDARRASTAYGKLLIDGSTQGDTIWDGD
ncbi:hypothetical protein PPMP20_29000 [Paraburkholderia phymatum]|uniref:Uncharacterized protein n=1 Tax=Paraburkholderia phymatum (strain DSM 17167 / CIP 108236 / LMG 21445 / STM815) TaxID=391038 RepID=B2JUV8_PARP8|nr:hypothetical protein [Paraburkholderia phymatum]ACC74736.1 conserved hypothetical protein [Paraburkholderia phymatum STM815]